MDVKKFQSANQSLDKSFLTGKVDKGTPATQPQHHSGKGTRARLNTAALKIMFGGKK